MLRSVGKYGRGVEIPNIYELWTWILDGGRNDNNEDGWWTEEDMDWNRGNNIAKWLVRHQIMFLKSVDTSTFVTGAHDAVAEEVGKDIVAQVVTNNASAYNVKGEINFSVMFNKNLKDDSSSYRSE